MINLKKVNTFRDIEYFTENEWCCIFMYLYIAHLDQNYNNSKKKKHFFQECQKTNCSKLYVIEVFRFLLENNEAIDRYVFLFISCTFIFGIWINV